MSIQIIRRPAVEAKTGKSRSGIYAEISNPTSDFPRPVKLGPKAVGWIEEEVDAWIGRRIALRNGGAAEEMPLDNMKSHGPAVRDGR